MTVFTIGQVDWFELIENARSGDENAMEAIISETRNYLLCIANGELNSALQSKFGGSDIVQQSLMEAHQSIVRFRGSTKAELKAWLKKIVVSNIVDESRRYKSTFRRNINREVSLKQDHENLARVNGKTASWHVGQNESKQILLKAVECLPDRQRQVIEARHRDGLTYAKIADEMQVSEVAVRKLWSRGIKVLKERVREG